MSNHGNETPDYEWEKNNLMLYMKKRYQEIAEMERKEANMPFIRRKRAIHQTLSKMRVKYHVKHNTAYGKKYKQGLQMLLELHMEGILENEKGNENENN